MSMRKTFNISYHNNMRASKAIYGIILMFTLLAGLDHLAGDSSLGVGVKLLLGALSITFAEIYSEVIGERIAKKSKLSPVEKRSIYSDAFAIISVSIIPSIAFFVAATNIISTSIAFTISYAYFLLMLFLFNYYAAIISNNSQLKSVLYATATLIVGCFVILVKYLFSH